MARTVQTDYFDGYAPSANTLAELATKGGYAGQRAWVFGSNRAFVCDPSSTATADGVLVAACPTGGRWLDEGLVGGITPGFRMTYLAEAAAKLGTADLVDFFLTFFTTPTSVGTQIVGTNCTQPILGDATDAVNSIGGVLRFTTGTDNAARTCRLIPIVSSSFAPTCGYNTPAIKFYRACRFRMNTTPTADTLAMMGSIGWHMGVIGANSITKYSLRVKSSGANYITSTVNVDTAWHVLRSYHDGVNAWFAVDNEAWQSMPDIAMFPLSAATESYWDLNLTKAAGAIDHGMDINWGLWVVSPS